VNDYDPDRSCARQPGIDGLPTGPPIGAFEDATAPDPRVERRRGHRVNAEREHVGEELVSAKLILPFGPLSHMHGCVPADATQDEQINDHQAEQRLFTELPPNIITSQSHHTESSVEI
jgi:hypothetical protein